MTLGAFDHNYRGFADLSSLKQDEKEYIINWLGPGIGYEYGVKEDKQAVSGNIRVRSIIICLSRDTS